MQIAWTNWPVLNIHDCITGRFGQDWGFWAPPNHPHQGTDVGLIRGTPWLAPGPGLCVPFYNGPSSMKPGQLTFGNGRCIRMFDDAPGGPLYVLSAHFDRAAVEPGDVVSAGQVLGFAGDTGDADGVHVHWQVCDNQNFPIDLARNRDAMAIPILEADMSPEEVLALIEKHKRDEEAAEIARLGSTQMDATEALVKRQRAMGRATSLEELVRANDPNNVPA